MRSGRSEGGSVSRPVKGLGAFSRHSVLAIATQTTENQMHGLQHVENSLLGKPQVGRSMQQQPARTACNISCTSHCISCKNMHVLQAELQALRRQRDVAREESQHLNVQTATLRKQLDDAVAAKVALEKKLMLSPRTDGSSGGKDTSGSPR